MTNTGLKYTSLNKNISSSLKEEIAQSVNDNFGFTFSTKLVLKLNHHV